MKSNANYLLFFLLAFLLRVCLTFIINLLTNWKGDLLFLEKNVAYNSKGSHLPTVTTRDTQLSESAKK